MPDYETHASKAQELLDTVHAKDFQRSGTLAIAAAQVQAILALAAAVDHQSRVDRGGAR
ncbi:hypothetical protein [Streptomyces sp. NPDC001914]|uniref:hypothetical protein n=1 Tax=Streptomyces sp. NPDC001914 TaxID=3364623 RepID=UPI0036BB9AE6